MVTENLKIKTVLLQIMKTSQKWICCRISLQESNANTLLILINLEVIPGILAEFDDISDIVVHRFSRKLIQ